jgi:hypothetical protein
VEALAGPIVVVTAVLGLAGGFKVVRPDPTAGALRAMRLPSSRVLVRVLGASELALALAAAVTFAPALLVLVGAAYLAFATFVTAALGSHTPLQSCGCFGQQDTPPSTVHVGIDIVAATTAFVAAVTGTPALDHVLPDQPWRAVPFVLLAVVCTYLCILVLTVLPLALRSSAPS